MKNFKILVIGLVFLTSCTVHKNSYQDNDSKVTINLINEVDSVAGQEKIIESLGLVIAKELIGFGYTKLVDFIDKEKDKYTASYNGVMQQQGFYKDSLNTIVVKRTLDNDVKEAMELKVKIQNHDNYFKLVPKSLKFNYAKAKITKKSCFCKEKDESKVLINSEITIMAAWEDKIGEKHLETLTTTNFSFIEKLNDTEESGYLFKEGEVIPSDMIKPIPNMSYKKGKEDPEGIVLVIKANINEVDGCENEVVKLAKLLKDSKDDVVGGVIDLTGLKDE
ncbi:hypothetical protein FHR24_000020 [Wenyingzhuangia heitensis]|uniref:Lipoprotein n=1 Tax=Wenyingzhuangia heitensis TaxID=1487859 RepID=A0ABX0U7H8_9FLAO|nr:hypothetical protein [Wenyingzhuangia heitensis]NIJ43581.1 hypothetical protein [Wenyingzhuangia heitensis]